MKSLFFPFSPYSFPCSPFKASYKFGLKSCLYPFLRARVIPFLFFFSSRPEIPYFQASLRITRGKHASFLSLLQIRDIVTLFFFLPLFLYRDENFLGAFATSFSRICRYGKNFPSPFSFFFLTFFPPFLRVGIGIAPFYPSPPSLPNSLLFRSFFFR